jgi:hypothetical protein
MNTSKMLICPTSGEHMYPAKVWESRLPDGKLVHYGQFQRHSHWGQECEWSYMVQRLNKDEENSSRVFI